MTNFRNRLRQIIAAHRLQKMVDARCQSFECVDYRKRRAAALKGRSRLASGG